MFGFEFEDPFSAAIARTREDRLEKIFQEFRSTGIVKLTERLTQNDPTLTELDLSNKQFNRILGGGLFYDLMDALGKNTTVTHLNLRNSKLVYTAGGLRFWEKFCEMLRDNISITHLDLSENALYLSSLEDWKLLFDALQTRKGKLLSLNLSLNQLCNFEMPYWEAFKKALTENAELRKLDLSKNGLGRFYTRFSVICETIENLPKLTHLNLNTNALGHLAKREWAQLCSLLETCPNITEIDLENNDLSTLGRSELTFVERTSNNPSWELFCKAISKNHDLTVLKISKNDLTYEKIWKNFCESLAKGHSIFSMGSGIVGPRLKELMNPTREDIHLSTLTELMQTNKEDRHLSTLTAVRFLRHGRLPKNRMFRNLPEVLVKKILRYLNISDALMTQVNFEIEEINKIPKRS